jgi:hypothetical protein
VAGLVKHSEQDNSKGEHENEKTQKGVPIKLIFSFSDGHSALELFSLWPAEQHRYRDREEDFSSVESVKYGDGHLHLSSGEL